MNFLLVWLSNDKLIDIQVLSEVISKGFDKALNPQMTTRPPMPEIVTENSVDMSLKVPDDMLKIVSSTQIISTTEKVIVEENTNVAEIISETIQSYVNRGNLEIPCE